MVKRGNFLSISDIVFRLLPYINYTPAQLLNITAMK